MVLRRAIPTMSSEITRKVMATITDRNPSGICMVWCVGWIEKNIKKIMHGNNPRYYQHIPSGRWRDMSMNDA
jgi:hypothetical protein